MRDIGKNIRQLRTQKNMTQDELAEKLFVTRQTVSNYETGRSRPDVEMLAKIAEILETDTNTVIYGPPEEVSKKQAYIKTAVSAVILLLLALPQPWLDQTTAKIQSLRFVVWPRFLFVIYYLPFLLLCTGWEAMQLLSLFTKLAPLSRKNGKRLFLGCLLFIVFYVSMTALTFLPFTKPRWLLYTLYFILGIWPEGFSFNWAYLLLPAGALLWLCGFPCKNAKKDRL